MNILDLALEMEKEGEQYYRDMAENCADKGLARILYMLADDQAKHRQLLQEMKDKHDAVYVQTEILKDAKNVFEEFHMDEKTCEMYDSQVDLYQKAQAIEKKSLEFYEQKAKESADPKERELFEKLAQEEKKHFFLLDNMIDFMSRPDTWLENAEFNHLEEY